tara:strand:+ start:11410 stop:12111 length:702 start_codon:yes stop_codon:yes gene_type:complete
MKQLPLKIFLTSLLSLASISANAEFIKGDWLHENDNLSFVDTETGLEWLSLRKTIGMSIDEVKGKLDSQFVGWRLPTEKEVIQVINGFTPFDYEGRDGFWSYNNDQIQSEVDEILHYFGVTQYFSTANSSLGTHLLDDGTVGHSGASSYHKASYYDRIYQAKYFYDDSDFSSANYGVFLVSDGGATLASKENPEINAANPNSPLNISDVPSESGIIGLGLALLGLRAREHFKF